MKKERTRLFSVLLAAVLVFGTLPVSALGTDVTDPPASAVDESVVDESSAAPEEQSAEEEAVAVQRLDPVDGYDMNIFFLDCGRMYYSVETIEKYITDASEAGFNYIQLAVGNEGMRFLLDDMSLTVGDKSYTSDQVKQAVQSGNTAYNRKCSYSYNPQKNELTQSEMNTIISFAREKGMGVIPCINSPGHMNAILNAANELTGSSYSYSNSARTIDITKEEATDFAKAFLQKYIVYFASKGCRYFNMGTDEFANDVSSAGFAGLQNANQYGKFVAYVNAVAEQIENVGMTPMAFNDGIYYNGVDNQGTFDKKIVI